MNRTQLQIESAKQLQGSRIDRWYSSKPETEKYFQLVRDLQVTDRPLWESRIEYHFTYDKSIEELIREVMTNKYTYNGVKRLPSSVFREVFPTQEVDCFEFRKDLKFIYIPTNKSVLLDLPYLITWKDNSTTLKFPYYNQITQSAASRWPRIRRLLSNDRSQTMLPGFWFTGNVVENHDQLLYEYFYAEGYYTIPNETYLSTYRPNGLDYPLGYPHDLVFNDQLLNEYPSYGDSLQIGLYTGYQTTSLYSPRTYYLYKRSDNSTFLSPAPPAIYDGNLIADISQLDDAFLNDVARLLDKYYLRDGIINV